MINPLLAQNMGRWAEVYFTHQPEEREQAVQELVRQLEQENKEREASILNFPVLSRGESSDQDLQATREQTVVCGGCGHENPVSKRFCGMCGVSLGPLTDTSLESVPDAAAEGPWAPADEVESEARNDRQHYFLEQRPRYDSEVEPPMFGSTEPSFSYSYRIFLGIALAIVLGVLGYVAWHKGPSLTQEGPQAPPPVADQSSAPDQGANRKADRGTQQAGALAAKTEDANTKAPKISNPENVAKETPPNNPASAAPKTSEHPSTAETQATPVEKAPLTRAGKQEKIASGPNGAVELAMALRYLNGDNGRRDPSQAAQWLWKSVAKQNSQATLMLADLYLHGDGIQKNCDQARILLDAAASKGQTGAATRLRNLQAFGCQ